MKQVVQNFRNGELKVDDVPPPSVSPGTILVATASSLISVGTEKSTVSVAKKGLVGKALERPDVLRKVVDKARKDGLSETLQLVSSRLDTPVALGYSCAGTALEVGPGVEGFEVGDRVACAGQNYASHAEVVTVPKNLSAKIPDGVSFEEASYVTLGAIALQGIRQADPRLGDHVAVIGLGLIGQLTTQLLKANGCRVIAADLVEEKRALAAQLGADEAVHPDKLPSTVHGLTQGRGADAVLITASTKGSEPVELAGEVARRKARIVVVGAVGMNVPREPFYKKELELLLSTSYGPGRYDQAYEEKGQDYPYEYVRWTEKRNMEAFLHLVAQKKLDLGRLTSHRFDVTAAEQAYRLVLDGSEPCLGVVLTYPDSAEAARSRVVRLQPAAEPKATSHRGRISFGIIGAGSHVKDMLLPALQKASGPVLDAICTSRGINAKAIAEKVGARLCTSDYREILRDQSIDAVLVGTRHRLHAELVIAALGAGKHVFVEKPLCTTETELDEIVELYREKAKDGIRLVVGFNRRHSAHLHKAREYFSGHRSPLVMVYRVNAGALPTDHWVNDPSEGGRLYGEVCHFVDYLQALCGAKITHVSAVPTGASGTGSSSDQALVSLRFDDGSIGSIIYAAEGSTALEKERCEVFGDGKSAVMVDFSHSEFYARGKKETFKTRGRDKGFQAQIDHFTASINGQASEADEFERVERVTRACLRIMDSLRTTQTYRV